MPKSYYPFNLYRFITVSDASVVLGDLCGLLDFVVLKESEVLRDVFDDVVTRVTEEPGLLKGSINRAGAKLGLTPTYTPEDKTEYNHLHNISEMVRANLGSLVGSYAQRRNIMNVIADLPDAEPKLIAQAYKKLTNKKVSSAQIANVLNALKNTGSVDSLPKPPAKLPLWATDMNHCTLLQEGNTLRLTLKTQTGKHELLFTIPQHVPLSGVKFTRPTIMRNDKNQIEFHFTAEQTVPPARENVGGWLGVDLGIVKNYTATAITPIMSSQSWTDTKQVRVISERIRVLQINASRVRFKSEQNEGRYVGRYIVQRQELKRLRKKITRLKNYRAHLIANKLVKIALLHNLGISLENLDWVPNSHWEQSLIQTKIRDEATRHSVRVKKVNAKNTSQTCSHCTSLNTKHSQRKITCNNCGIPQDRDANASKNIAKRALKQKTLPKHYYRWSLRNTTVTGSLPRAPFTGLPVITITQSLTFKTTKVRI